MPRHRDYADIHFMSLPPSLTRSVGFVVRNGRPVGTCFLVRVQSELHPERPDWDYGYVVTAEHVARPDSTPNEVWMGVYGGKLERGFFPEWQYADGGDDIAVAPWLSGSDERNWLAMRMYADATDSIGIVAAHLGTTVHYVGLLAPVASMATRGQPMVRTASLGAMDVHNVEYHDKGSQRIAYVAHLIDCRSYGGFSGSPVFLSAQFPGPLDEPLPAPWREHPMADRLGSMNYFAALFGMLVGYGHDAGVGVVLAVERIRMALNSQDMIAMRHDEDEKRECQGHQ